MTLILDLDSQDLHMIETLVGWNTKLKLIEALTRKRQAFSYAKKLYQSSGVRAPAGMPGHAACERHPKIISQSYVALATSYQHLRACSAGLTESMIAAYSLYLNICGEARHKCNINTWLSLARDLEAGTAGLYSCQFCGGGHLWQYGVCRMHKNCMWCGSRLNMPHEAITAAYAAQEVPIMGV